MQPHGIYAAVKRDFFCFTSESKIVEVVKIEYNNKIMGRDKSKECIFLFAKAVVSLDKLIFRHNFSVLLFLMKFLQDKRV